MYRKKRIQLHIRLGKRLTTKYQKTDKWQWTSLLWKYYSYETKQNCIIKFGFSDKSFPFRSWEKLCVVLKGSQIVFYKDQKTYRSKPEETFRSESPVDLIGGVAEVAADYTKKKHVFRLKWVPRAQYREYFSINPHFLSLQATKRRRLFVPSCRWRADESLGGGHQQTSPGTGGGTGKVSDSSSRLRQERWTQAKIVLHS